MRGSWLTDTVFAKVTGYEIQGWRAGSEERIWTLPLSGLSCAGSTEAGDGHVGLIVHEEGRRGKGNAYQPCAQVTAFDLDTGRRLGNHTVTGTTGDVPVAFDRLAISGETAAVAGVHGGAAFDLRTGRLRWRPGASWCVDEDCAGGPRLVAVVGCYDTTDEATYHVQLLDPATGDVRYRLPPTAYRLPPTARRPAPPRAVHPSGRPRRGLGGHRQFHRAGRLRPRRARPPALQVHGGGRRVHPGLLGRLRPHRRGRRQRALYVGTERDAAAQVVAFSLAAGRPTGQRTDGQGAPFDLLRTDGPNVLAHQIGPGGPRVVSLDGRTLRLSTLLQDADGGTVPGDASEVRYAHGRLYLSSELLYGPSASDDSGQYLAYGCATTS
ncbi:hypothetical protein ABZZ79_29590 [Streptomyces sp. NPDC006458]|uniref:hypothetical protein n=1 Tax=Streptomyces sp. NPDC006458 TaxID=3154302 RepID=UPI0033B2B775